MAIEDWYSSHEMEDDSQENEIIDYISIEHETKKARLFVTKKGKFWVPKSVGQIEDDNVLVLPNWFTIKYLEEPPSNA